MKCWCSGMFVHMCVTRSDTVVFANMHETQVTQSHEHLFTYNVTYRQLWLQRWSRISTKRWQDPQLLLFLSTCQEVNHKIFPQRRPAPLMVAHHCVRVAVGKSWKTARFLRGFQVKSTLNWHKHQHRPRGFASVKEVVMEYQRSRSYRLVSA